MREDARAYTITGSGLYASSAGYGRSVEPTSAGGSTSRRLDQRLVAVLVGPAELDKLNHQVIPRAPPAANRRSPGVPMRPGSKVTNVTKGTCSTIGARARVLDQRRRRARRRVRDRSDRGCRGRSRFDGRELAA